MKTVTYPSGVKLIYDDDLKVGDTISAYHKGYHVITKIEKRSGATPLFYYNTIIKENGSPNKPNTIRCCDASYCRKAKETLGEYIKKKTEELENLKQFYFSLHEKEILQGL